MGFKLNKEGRVLAEYYGDNRKQLVIKQGDMAINSAYEIRTHYEDDVVSESILEQEALGMIKNAKGKTFADGCCLTKDGREFYDTCVDLCSRWYDNSVRRRIANGYDFEIYKETDGTFTYEECDSGTKSLMPEYRVMDIIKRYGENPATDEEFYEHRNAYRLDFTGAAYYFFNDEYLERVAKQKSEEFVKSDDMPIQNAKTRVSSKTDRGHEFDDVVQPSENNLPDVTD